MSGWWLPIVISVGVTPGAEAVLGPPLLLVGVEPEEEPLDLDDELQATAIMAISTAPAANRIDIR